MSDLFNYLNPKNGLHSPMISQDTWDVVQKHADVCLGCLVLPGHLCPACMCGGDVWCCLVAQTFNSAIIYDRDYGYSYFGFKVTHTTHRHSLTPLHAPASCTLLPSQTLERSYLLRINGKGTCALEEHLLPNASPDPFLLPAVAERPQHMLMRVAIGIHREDLDAVLETYTLLSEKWFTHASPTLFNAGTCRPQLSSCFLLSMKEDSIDVCLCTSHCVVPLCDVPSP